ncbi:hypothetical protein NE237_002478 [Protea cynaroides]|uniref:Uncharacterized protein n=1 Tax=Protea cynaroides TaxID=273540 RepID=A0A9Q0KVC1_9MAGN|nr:hypothetical protein NE237_002478 [Protea cynaroides]
MRSSVLRIPIPSHSSTEKEIIPMVWWSEEGDWEVKIPKLIYRVETAVPSLPDSFFLLNLFFPYPDERRSNSQLSSRPHPLLLKSIFDFSQFQGIKHTQWGKGGIGSGGDDEKPITQKTSSGSSKMANVKAAASTGFGKAKTAAVVGAEKVKTGTSVGINWVKTKYQKRSSNSSK